MDKLWRIRVERVKANLAKCKTVDYVQVEREDYSNEKQIVRVEIVIASLENSVSVKEKGKKSLIN